MKIHLQEHRSRINMRVTTAPLVPHSITRGHSFQDYTWRIIDQIPHSFRGGDKVAKLQQLEQRWIFNLQTHAPGVES